MKSKRNIYKSTEQAIKTQFSMQPIVIYQVTIPYVLLVVGSVKNKKYIEYLLLQQLSIVNKNIDYDENSQLCHQNNSLNSNKKTSK